MQSTPATADAGAAPAAVTEAPAQHDAFTAPGGWLMEEDRGGRECGEDSQRETVTNDHLQSSSITDMPWESPEG